MSVRLTPGMSDARADSSAYGRASEAAPKASLVTCGPGTAGMLILRWYSARDRSVKPCLSQPPPGTWMVVAGTPAGEFVHVMGPVVVPNGPPPTQTVLVNGVKPQRPGRFT